MLHAHHYCFKDLPPEVSDIFGYLLRKTDSQAVRFSKWQKSVQKASQKPGVVPPEVMADFQKLKFFTGADYKEVPARPVVDALPFTWSPSRLSTFETCPAQFAANYYYKTIPYTETVHTIWGTRVHAEAEKYLKGEPSTDPEAFKVVEPFVQLLVKLPGDRFIEHRLCLDSSWKPCGWGEATGRMIIDFGVLDGKSFKCYDFKTGKMKEDTTQMQLYAVALALTFPEVDDFDFRYIWLKDRKTTGFKLSRKELLPVYKDVRERINRMRQAWESENFPMRKNGLCRQYCGNTGCPYCGGR